MLLSTSETVVTLDKNEEYDDRVRGQGKQAATQSTGIKANRRFNDFVCRVEGCPCECAARGLCWKHYMRQRRYGSVSFRKRRYNMSPRCRYCGATNADAFYRQYKSICKRCKKLRAIIQRRERENARTPFLQTTSEKAAK